MAEKAAVESPATQTDQVIKQVKQKQAFGCRRLPRPRLERLVNDHLVILACGSRNPSAEERPKKLDKEKKRQNTHQSRDPGGNERGSRGRTAKKGCWVFVSCLRRSMRSIASRAANWNLDHLSIRAGCFRWENLACLQQTIWNSLLSKRPTLRKHVEKTYVHM